MAQLRPILLVEDNDNDIELTLVALEKAKVANPVDVVRDGVEALEYLRREGQWNSRKDEHPVVILLDKKLPRLDGHDVLKRIKSDDELRHIPVVMLTSSREETDLTRSYDLGVNAYVVKPVKFNDFMDAIRDVGGFWAVLNEGRPRGASTVK
ncbi:response regulator [Caballeronia sp. LZ062]|uniref:response regulator n=1 Tax=unclassified Caballeronia TaxID=2646786 RepID=UPI0028605EDB|nr:MULTISPECIES: response regulator [unclassified Caballeronia]MDR5856222.1 response regulator [Caballeronia sp. LZ050]MDR5872893.1 response regulator [Caballeronia sp. LZ062]